jgi:hypothetical protein
MDIIKPITVNELAKVNFHSCRYVANWPKDSEEDVWAQNVGLDQFKTNDWTLIHQSLMKETICNFRYLLKALWQGR